MSGERTRKTSCPADVLGFIPWYPDGLDETQRGLVETHAAGCSACRDEIAMLQGFSEPDAAPDPEQIYAQVLARMEASAPDAKAADGDGPAATVSELRPSTRSSSRPGREAPASRASGWRRVALAASLLLALAVGVLVGPSVLKRDPEPVVYRSASAAPESPDASPAPAALEVVFREDASAARINETLRALGARVTSGPSQLGVYRLELGADVDLTAAKKLLTEDRDGVATFAEKPLRP